MFKPPLSTQVGRNARVKKLIWQRFVFAFFAAFLYILDHYLISHWDVKTLDSTPGSLIPGVDLMIHPTWPTPACPRCDTRFHSIPGRDGAFEPGNPYSFPLGCPYNWTSDNPACQPQASQVSEFVMDAIESPEGAAEGAWLGGCQE